MRASESLSSIWNIVREDDYGNAIIEQDGLFYVVNVDGTNYNFDISSLWERARKQLSEGLTCIPSVLPIRDVKFFDLSGFFSHCLYPSFIKAGCMTIVNFQGLPEHQVEARGIIMQMREGEGSLYYAETFGEDVPDWC